jgi:hypothetical protein
VTFRALFIVILSGSFIGPYGTRLALARTSLSAQLRQNRRQFVRKRLRPRIGERGRAAIGMAPAARTYARCDIELDIIRTHARRAADRRQMIEAKFMAEVPGNQVIGAGRIAADADAAGCPTCIDRCIRQLFHAISL